jgi:hypothetical protein
MSSPYYLGAIRIISTLYLQAMKLRKYTLDQLKISVANSNSTAQALEKLNISPAGGNYQTFRKAVKYFEIDTSHFKGQKWAKDRKFGPKRHINDYLSNKYSIGSNMLKHRLFNEKLLERKCYSCNLTQWMGFPIPLELEHIDGNHQNNNLDNLTILCPNCHSFTSTYRGRNKGSYKS